MEKAELWATAALWWTTAVGGHHWGLNVKCLPEAHVLEYSPPAERSLGGAVEPQKGSSCKCVTGVQVLRLGSAAPLPTCSLLLDYRGGVASCPHSCHRLPPPPGWPESLLNSKPKWALPLFKFLLRSQHEKNYQHRLFIYSWGLERLPKRCVGWSAGGHQQEGNEGLKGVFWEERTTKQILRRNRLEGNAE